MHKASRVIVVSAFSDMRAMQVFEALSSFADARLLTSDFSHTHKRYKTQEPSNTHFIHVPAYQTNLSFKRMFSHFLFALRSAKWLKTQKADVVYICAPPNTAAFFCQKAAQKISARVVIDVVDLWPEALPLPHRIKAPFMFTVGRAWKWLRDAAIQKADEALFESRFVQTQLTTKKGHVLALAKKTQIGTIDFSCVSKTPLIIGYIGGIGNIIDFDALVKLCLAIQNWDVSVEIIGDGEKRDTWLAKLKTAQIHHRYFGLEHDPVKKHDIMRRWAFGYNGYKDNTAVALSYKSLDYLENGLPILNTAQMDTFELVETCNIGFNFSTADPLALAARIDALTFDALLTMHERARQAFLDHFSWELFVKRLEAHVFLD